MAIKTVQDSTSVLKEKEQEINSLKVELEQYKKAHEDAISKSVNLKHVLKSSELWSTIDEKINIHNKFNTLNLENLELDKSSAAGIYLMYIKNPKSDWTKEYFKPIYVGQSKDFVSRWNQHKTLIEAAMANKINFEFNKYVEDEIDKKYHRIASYLDFYNLGIENVYFTILEDYTLEKFLEKKQIDGGYQKCLMDNHENKWIRRLSSNKWGFNNTDIG